MRKNVARFYWKLYRRILIVLNIMCGVDFASNHSMEELGFSNEIGVEYSATPSHDLKKLLLNLNIQKTDSILDFGAGKGAAMLTMSAFPFQRIDGVEISDKLCDIARSNFNKLGLKNLSVFHSEAQTYINLDDYNYYYFFNPFPKHVFQKVIENLENSYNRKSRKINVIYYNPSCREIMASFSFLKLKNKYMGRYFEVEIYDNAHVFTTIDDYKNT